MDEYKDLRLIDKKFEKTRTDIEKITFSENSFEEKMNSLKKIKTPTTWKWDWKYENFYGIINCIGCMLKMDPKNFQRQIQGKTILTDNFVRFFIKNGILTKINFSDLSSHKEPLVLYRNNYAFYFVLGSFQIPREGNHIVL